MGIPDALMSRADRHGVRLLIAPTLALPDSALDAILSWRLGQYLLTRFYDAKVVWDEGILGEDAGGVHDADVHGLAIDAEGDLLTYMTLKQPEGLDGFRYGSADRPPFPCEEVHGRGWQECIENAGEVAADQCWELARFVTDQRRREDPLIHRGALEIALVAARLACRPAFTSRVRLVTGDLDPDIALRNLRDFFIPVAPFPPHQVNLPAGHPLRPPYANHAPAPVPADAATLDLAPFLRCAVHSPPPRSRR